MYRTKTAGKWYPAIESSHTQSAGDHGCVLFFFVGRMEGGGLGRGRVGGCES